VPETLTAEQEALRNRVGEFADRVLAPLESGLDRDRESPVPAELRKQVAASARAAGIHHLLQPAADGRHGTGVIERVIAVETLARANLRLARYALGPEPGALAAAAGRLRERYLVPLLAGDKRSALAITEPRDGLSPTLGARETGIVRISGRKSYVTGGAEADFFVVSLTLAATAEQPQARALVVIDRDAPGVRVERSFHSADGSGHVQLAFEDVRVPDDQLLMPPAQGRPPIGAGLNDLRLRVAARACGSAFWAIDHVTERLRAPHREGIPLGQREGVRLRLADMALLLYAARSALYRTARLADHGHDVRHEVLVAKILCTENAVQVVDRAVLLAGGEALIDGHPLERMQRELRTLLIAEGASDVLRQSLGKGIVERGFRGF
jgi:acyl-CoA dehydrogenase